MNYDDIAGNDKKKMIKKTKAFVLANVKQLRCADRANLHIVVTLILLILKQKVIAAKNYDVLMIMNKFLKQSDVI